MLEIEFEVNKYILWQHSGNPLAQTFPDQQTLKHIDIRYHFIRELIESQQAKTKKNSQVLLAPFYSATLLKKRKTKGESEGEIWYRDCSRIVPILPPYITSLLKYYLIFLFTSWPIWPPSPPPPLPILFCPFLYFCFHYGISEGHFDCAISSVWIFAGCKNVRFRLSLFWFLFSFFFFALICQNLGVAFRMEKLFLLRELPFSFACLQIATENERLANSITIYNQILSQVWHGLQINTHRDTFHSRGDENFSFNF